MPELIENGHLYVAQPPLYRITSGKKEIYMKDDGDLNAFLLKRVSEKEKIVLKDEKEVSGNQLVRIMSGLIKFYDSLDRLSRKGYNKRFIEFLASDGPKDRRLFKDKDFMTDLFRKLDDEGFLVSDVHQDEDEGYFEFMISETRNGGSSSTVNWEFLSSPELRQLLGISKEFRQIKEEAFIYGEQGEKIRVEDPKTLLESMMERAKKGLSVQRYKGLGEMNPDQLWKTTMDPENRNMLQVRVKDGVKADDIFNVLMGDKVEPRREFIQNNALEVSELDI
jgi:DNA gyrase subunit B